MHNTSLDALDVQIERKLSDLKARLVKDKTLSAVVQQIIKTYETQQPMKRTEKLRELLSPAG